MLLTEGTEVPPMFALWSGINSISSVLGRNISMDMGTYTVYPNMYTVLVAGSGRCRKSTAIGVMEKVIKGITPPLNLIAQKITPEGLIQAIRKAEPPTKQPGEDTSVIVAPDRAVCDGLVVCDELATFINKRSQEAGLAALLIQFFDCRDEVKYTTKTHGDEVANNTCLGMIGASTFEWLRTAFDEHSIGGGLTSRVIFVYVQNPPPPVAITTFSQEKELVLKNLQAHLGRIRNLKGKVTFSPAAKAWYVDWYENTWAGGPSPSPFFDNKYLSGYASRRALHLKKISMCLAAADFTLEIDLHHIEMAHQILLQAELLMPHVMSLIVTSEGGHNRDLVYNKIKSKGQISRRQLMTDMSYKMDAREMADILNTLELCEEVKQVISEGTGTVFYMLGDNKRKEAPIGADHLQGLDNRTKETV